ncbi:uncharacterized protein LOC112906554 [Agrilus planipennis]|uniref:Uncharacterized protein LOC112906554 n=1 Tax=Agrilus planipennis TaxID=224129 RepID=A0A7F5RKW6_AGRPL|nr:uncharacterized protein LOC112906554 [Agrilus planipennis]
MTTAIADQLSLQKQICTDRVTLFTLAGTEIKPNHTTIAEVIIDNIKRTIQFFVIDKCAMDVQLLIGQNFTELYDINYSKIGNQLNFTEVTINKLNVNLITQTTLNIGINHQKHNQPLIDLLNNYRDCIANSLNELGVTELTKMTITLSSEKPIARRPRQFSDYERAQIREIVGELLLNGIIRESCSPYALPLIEEQLRRLSGHQYFTSLGLFSGYYHIPMATESIP